MPPTIPLEINAVLQNEVVDALAKESEKFCFLHIHRTQERVVAARSSNLIVNSEINGQVSYPVRFLEGNNVRVLAQAPTQNACPGPGRPNDKDRFVYAVLHFS